MCLLKLSRDGVVSHVAGEESCDEVVIDLRGSCPHEVQESGFEGGVNVVYTYSNICRPCIWISCCLKCAWCVHCVAEMLCWRAYNGVGLTNLRSRSLSRSRSIVEV
jgi:hypothetical protein